MCYRHANVKSVPTNLRLVRKPISGFTAFQPPTPARSTRTVSPERANAVFSRPKAGHDIRADHPMSQGILEDTAMDTTSQKLDQDRGDQKAKDVDAIATGATSTMDVDDQGSHEAGHVGATAADATMPVEFHADKPTRVSSMDIMDSMPDTRMPKKCKLSG